MSKFESVNEMSIQNQILANNMYIGKKIKSEKR